VDLALSEPENPRKATAGQLGEIVGALGGEAVILGDAAQAAAYALAHRKEYDCLLFAGSLYFVSAIRQHCISREEPK
jgi:folylpolyglutamate synthase/dihydropteroate synthase